MSNYYSDILGDGTDATTTYDKTNKADPGISHGRLRYKKATYVGSPQTTDTLRLMSFKSNDRIIEMFVTGDGGSAAGASNIGLHLSGVAHDGAVVDADLFCAALDTSSAIARVDEFKQSTTLGDADRGKTLWALAAIGAATYTVDPQVEFDLTLTPSTNWTAGDDTTIEVEVIYTAGD